ncbi:hypothetical protein ACFVX6_18005 [Streptomyces sp. NPDC058289]|uniref:hypothetical protein n=1 Tax=Streptomyces sp. NPDC058289 TaxID=3346425 RepID=UPI0036E6F0C7
MSEYPQQPYPQQPPQYPAPKQGMSTGKKIALGCGIPTVLGLVLVGGCTAIVGKAADDVSKEIDKSSDSSIVQPEGAKPSGGGPVDAEPDITKDVAVKSCKVAPTNYGTKEVEVELEFTNSGERRYSYVAEGEVLVNGEKKADITSFAQNLDKGQKYTDDKAGSGAYDVADKLKAGDKLECKLIKVSRNSF